MFQILNKYGKGQFVQCLRLLRINEECGVFGIWNHPEAAQLTYMGLSRLQHRGRRVQVFMLSDQNELKGERGLGLLTEAIKDDQMEQLKGYQHAIGRVRYATSGNKGIENIRQLLYHFYDMSVGICHNGNLINAKSLRYSEFRKTRCYLPFVF